MKLGWDIKTRSFREVASKLFLMILKILESVTHQRLRIHLAGKPLVDALLLIIKYKLVYVLQ